MKALPCSALLALTSGTLATSACAERWVDHRDPHGFTISHPAGWRVQAGGAGRVTVRSADHHSLVAVLPFRLPEAMSADAWLRSAPRRLADLFPGGRLTRVSPLPGRSDEALAAMTYGKEGRANLLCSRQGDRGMLYAIAAPQACFVESRTTLTRILQSFSYAAPAPAAASSAIPLVTWNDPREGAFSMDVPRGWKVDGGMYRFAPLDTRAQVDIVSPDGKIRLRLGDQTVMTFSEPTAMTEFQGLREGSVHSIAGAYDVKLFRYFPGAPFSRDYLQNRIAARYRDVTFADTQERADFVKKVSPLYRQAYGQFARVDVDAGEARFSGTGDSGRVQGYAFCQTFRMRSDATSIWWAPIVLSYVAAEGHQGQAEALLGKVAATFRYNPSWVQRQAAQGNQVVRTASNLMRQSSEMISSLLRSNDSARDEHMRQWTNTMAGETDVANPQTGETWKVTGGANYYWRRGSDGAMVGTNTYNRPDIDFTLLREW